MKTVVVTGGTLRLGAAIAAHLRAVGWRVLTTSHRPEAGADILADLTEDLGAAKLYAKAMDLLDGTPPDALVNNAALFVGDEDAIRKVNFVAPQKLTMMMAGRETGRGTVVNILDAMALLPTLPAGSAATAGYYAAKRALADYTRTSAALFADTLRVNAVSPGSVLAPTDVHEKAAVTLLDHPTPEDVAEAVDFLMSARATTGVILPVDGGLQLQNLG